jgi:autotransporter-associated beta strand protein
MNQNATGGDATFIVNGSDTALHGGGNLDFINSSTGGDATIIVNGGLKDGGHVLLSTVETESRAHFEIFGNGEAHLELVDGQIGSLEGDGLVFLGPLNLTVGGNSSDTTFSGVIADGGPIGGVGGSLTIASDGSLELTNANTYTGLTAVSGGTLIASNTTGSATGTGPVTVYAGTLRGNGIIGGAVTLGDGVGRSALLAPSYKATKFVTLTIQGYLTFNPDAIYTYTFKARGSRAKTDKVVANGVTINSTASLNLSARTQGTLTQGLVLTVIDNTALTPIAGTFSNLPDGGIVTVNGNNFQANYEGGDGNDLTLTVVP